MTSLIEHYGLVVLVLTILVEASGVPVPGETALIAAAIAAGRGHLSFAAVLVTASLAAIAGGEIGYALGRYGGRRLLRRWDLTHRLAERFLDATERFFNRHGGKAVALGRFFPVIRVTTFWTAGIARMNPWRFALWNVVGGIAWAAGIGTAAYVLGSAAVHAVERYGAIAVLGVAALVVLGWVVLRRLERRLAD